MGGGSLVRREPRRPRSRWPKPIPAPPVKLLTAAADKEDAVGKHPVTPGPVLPAREQLGDLLLGMGRPREALAAYEAALACAPKRFNGLAGETALASGFYKQLLALCGPSCERPEAWRARAFVSGG